MATKPRPQAHAMPESATWPCATRAHLPARLTARSAGASPVMTKALLGRPRESGDPVYEFRFLGDGRSDLDHKKANGVPAFAGTTARRFHSSFAPDSLTSFAYFSTSLLR